MNTWADAASGRTARANGQGERLQGKRPHVSGGTCVWGNTYADTAPGRTARANGQGERLQGKRPRLCGETHVSVERHMEDTAPNPAHT